MHKRIQWLDAMKGFMIIFVVLCHSLVLNHSLGVQGHVDALTLYVINTFIMPCFFAISGFLYRKVSSWRQYLLLWYKKGLGLFIPYLICSIALYYYMHAKGSLISIWYQPIFLVWFLFALFFIFIIVGTLDLLHVSKGVQLIIYLVALVAQTKLNWWDGPNFDMNPVACTAGYITFFYVGYLIKGYFKRIKSELSDKRLTLVLFILLALGLIIQEKATGVFPYNTDQVMLSDSLTKLLSIFAFFSLFMAFSKDVKLKWLNKIGRGTLVVYLTHYFVLHAAFVEIMLNTQLRSPMIQSGIRFIAGILGSLIMMWIINRVGLVKFIFYPRKYLDKIFLKDK